MKLSRIALLFLSLTSHSSPHLCTKSSQVQPGIIKASDSLSTARPVEKSLKFCCYHRCVSWRQAVVYWRWDGANFHWAEDSPVQPLLAVHKQEFLVCACVQAESVHACLLVGTHKCGGKSNWVLFSIQIPEIKTTTEKKILHFVFSKKQKSTESEKLPVFL